MQTQPAPQCTTDWSITDVSPWHEGQVLQVTLRSLPRPPAPWQVVELLAEGGMAELYRVRCGPGGAEAVLKCPHRHHRAAHRLDEALLQEAAWLQDLELPGTPAVLDQGRLEDGRAFYVMTRVAGETLRDWLLRGPPPLAEAVRVVRDVARVVAGAHARGVLHRDLKPSNIMRGPDGKITVVDWGLATRVEAEGAPGRRLAGTPAYLAPEIVTRAAGALMPTADVWALGCTLVCLLEGQPPNPWRRPSRSILGLAAPRRAEAWEGDARVPAELALAELVARCLASEPAERIPHAGRLAWELDAWLAVHGGA